MNDGETKVLSGDMVESEAYAFPVTADEESSAHFYDEDEGFTRIVQQEMRSKVSLVCVWYWDEES